MKRLSLLSILLLLITQLMAQDLKIKLWPDGAPNKTTVPGEEKYYINNGTYRYENISEAELFVYLPEEQKNTGAAVVICPGGGYWVEAIDHEGFQIAEYLKGKGVAAIVLKYRLPYGNSEVPLSDALQAIRYVRSKADEWHLDPSKVGIAGASAGGHLASTAGTHFTLGDANATDPLQKLSSRPDFMLLLYPVISFDEKITHVGSRTNLIGKTNDWKIASEFSNELQVTEDTPPTFLVLADDDHGVVPENSIRFYMALKKYDIPAEMHIFAKGGHGFGMKKLNLPTEKWPDLFYEWMQTMQIVPNP
ncbi:alpha/beta hydrolase [Mangrovibacterium diazotrophicum]|uniref:Acetyl esterase/lipase n=1 Tax=Mangrovibacterium diazotrophicum TaxID=1261403 RepID=A0A419VYK7_9BACT|nr:alpha/beta hydrolase [Mangrovibacterium diazotrophicum]RKD88325.1 acetyl esterase/lipase [Mangrovibacterium diazotrophicum]